MSRTLLFIILIILLLAALPTWPYSTGWGYYPSGGLGLLLVIVLLIILLRYRRTAGRLRDHQCWNRHSRSSALHSEPRLEWTGAVNLSVKDHGPETQNKRWRRHPAPSRSGSCRTPSLRT